MGVISQIVNKIKELDVERSDLFQACKDGYVSISRDDKYIKVIFCDRDKVYKGSRGCFTDAGLEIHHHMVFNHDIINVTVDELIEHGAKDKR